MNQERAVVKLADMRHPPQNARMHPEKQIKELIRSLDMFGQCRDIVIDESNVILAGNGLKIAMEKHGDTEAAVIRLLGLSEKQKLKFILADNKTFTLGIDDLDGINALIAELERDIDVPGYDEDTLKALISEGDTVTERLMSYGTLDESSISAIRANSERREALPMSGEASPPASIPPLTTPDAADIRRTIICPDCGREICL